MRILRLLLLLLCAACALPAQEEAQVVESTDSGLRPAPPLSLERIVIRGENRPRPLSLPPAERERPAPPQAPEARPAPKPQALFWSDSLEVSGGSFRTWRIRNAYHMRKRANNLGLSDSYGESAGPREGYGRTENRHDIEYQWLSPDRPQVSLSLSLRDDALELPEPADLWWRGRTRAEDRLAAAARVELPRPGGASFRLYAEAEQATQQDADRAEFQASLQRFGVLHRSGTWETALSLEKDDRDKADTWLSRLFVQNTRHPLDERNTAHWGLGAYAFSSRNDFLEKERFVYFDRQGEQRQSAALAAFLLLEHRVSRNLSIHWCGSQLYETHGFVDSYFDRPELSRPSDFVLPTRNVRFSTGLTHELGEGWRWMLSWERDYYRDLPVTVLDGDSDDRKLTADIWDSGRDTELSLRLDGRLLEVLSFQLYGSHHDPRWDDPSLDYTPYASDNRARAVLEYDADIYGAGLEYAWRDGFLTYPGRERIDASGEVSLRVFFQARDRVTGWLKLKNLLDGTSFVTPGYPTAGRSVLAGLGVRL